MFCLNNVAFRVYISGRRVTEELQDVCFYLSGVSTVVTNKETWVNLTKPVENTSDLTPKSVVCRSRHQILKKF